MGESQIDKVFQPFGIATCTYVNETGSKHCERGIYFFETNNVNTEMNADNGEMSIYTTEIFIYCKEMGIYNYEIGIYSKEMGNTTTKLLITVAI